MKKILALLLAVAMVAVLFTGCGKKTEEVEFGWGTLDYGKSYTNEFFGFSIDLNPDLTYLTPQEIADENPPLDENGDAMDPVDVSQIEDLSAEPIVQFVYGSLYPKDEEGEFNSYINIFSENMNSIGSTINKEDYVKNYLEFSKYMYEESSLDIESYPLEKVWISDRQFAKGTLKIDYDKYTVYQEMYAITKSNYILVIMIVYSNDQEKQMFEDMINSIEID